MDINKAKPFGPPIVMSIDDKDNRKPDYYNTETQTGWTFHRNIDRREQQCKTVLRKISTRRTICTVMTILRRTCFYPGGSDSTYPFHLTGYPFSSCGGPNMIEVYLV